MPSIQRPSSPTELSYTQLVQLTTPSRDIERCSVNNSMKISAVSANDSQQRLRFRNSQTPEPLNASRTTPYPHRSHSINTHTHHNIELSVAPDRVANLAKKLQTSTIQSQSKQHDIQQFITMLQGMQHTVSRTVDEQQRNRKSQALNLLLNMFERVLEGQNFNGNANQLELLEQDNERLHTFCKQRDDEMMRMEQEIQQLINEKNELQRNLTRAQNECNEEKKRSREAELVASESETVRDGLFASYGQLTEANVELERAVEECKSEKMALRRDLHNFKEEVSQLQTQCSILNQQLKEKDFELAQTENKIDTMHTQLATHLQSLELTNNARHRLQDELHNSQRNATSLSQQLLEIREKYTMLQKESGVNRRNHQIDETHQNSLAILLQEEQFKRKDLEVANVIGQEEIRKLVRENANLKTKINEMNARLEASNLGSQEKAIDTYSVTSHESLQKNNNLVTENTMSLLDYLEPDLKYDRAHT
eukprot:scaffold52441_cov76-Cyclotella_meneghiniana.AAC.1